MKLTMKTLCFWSVLLCPVVVPAADVRMNQIQVIGTHNSYHIAPDPAMLKLIGMTGRNLSQTLEYTHRPLEEQFTELQMRSIEIDVFADPDGGLFAEPRGQGLLAAQNQPTGDDPDPDGELSKPGFKVLHVQDIDFRTTVRTFRGALEQIRSWSDEHPQHIPLFVLVELKDQSPSPLLTTPVMFTEPLLDELDELIRSVLTEENLITPDFVRGDHATLREAVVNDGWPTLEKTRGRVMFALDNPGRHRDLYVSGHPSLAGRVLFATPKQELDAEAAFFKLNDPVAAFDDIQRLVREGFIVRTRADAATEEARRNDTTRRDRAFASGAQIISTDFPEPVEKFSDYSVRFPDGTTIRRNSVNGDGASVELRP